MSSVMLGCAGEALQLTMATINTLRKKHPQAMSVASAQQNSTSSGFFSEAVAISVFNGVFGVSDVEKIAE
jgi:hypothetical protein